MAPSVDLVVITRNRPESLQETLSHLPPIRSEISRILVVDNASEGELYDAASRLPDVEVVALPANAGCGGRNVGARLSRARYIAFSDDDSWWAPGSISAAVTFLEANSETALVAARVLVGPERSLDPVSAEMEANRETPVTGFLACSCVVRRSVFLAAGGFDRRYVVGSEEELLAIDLMTAGWRLDYCPQATVHHHPSPRDRHGRSRRQRRNALWTALRRSPLPQVPARLVSALAAGAGRPGDDGISPVLRSLPRSVGERRLVASPARA